MAPFQGSICTKSAIRRLSTVHRGVAFEERALKLLRDHFSMSLTRVGGRGDGGIDLLGWWWLPPCTPTASATLSAGPSSTGEESAGPASIQDNLATSRRRRIRVVGQCKAEKKKMGPNYVRELEGVMYRLAATANLSEALPDPNSSPSGNASSVDLDPTEIRPGDPTVAILVSQSQFTKSTMLRAQSSPIPFILLHLPMGERQETISITSNAIPTLETLSSVMYKASTSPSCPEAPEPATTERDKPAQDGSIATALCNMALVGTRGLLKGQMEVRWERDLTDAGPGKPGLWWSGKRLESWSEDGIRRFSRFSASLHTILISPPPPSLGGILEMSAPCFISSNPDISGIGVRVAIYIQNLLCFIPAIWAIWDGHVSDYELESAETQSTTNLVLAFAILISCIVQALTLGLTNYHAAIVLSLSWMNNTNAFIYFILYVQYKGQEGREHVEPRWSAWVSHIKAQVRSILYMTLATSNEDPGQPGESERDTVKGSQGSLHLTLMAALGIWLWNSPVSFGTSESTCAVEHGQLAILGASVPFGSNPLRLASLILYSLFLLPGLNLLLPMTAFLCLYFWHRRSCQGVASSVEDASQTVRSSQYTEISRTLRQFCLRCMRAQVFPVCVGLGFLFAINVVFIADIELTLHRNIGLQDREEEQWGFGQILAILLVLMPLRDLVEAILARRLRRHELQIKEHELSAAWASALLRRDVDRILELVKEGADPNVRAEDGWSALEVAVSQSNWDAVLNLVSGSAHRADVNAPFHDGRTALETVTLDLEWDGFQTLAKAGADLHASFSDGTFADGRSPIQSAAEGDGWEAVQFLINASADTSFAFEDGSTLLEHAALGRQWNVVRSLLESSNCDVNTIFKRHYNSCMTVLQSACSHIWDRSTLDFITFLMDMGADPNIPGPQFKDELSTGRKESPPLLLACSWGSLSGSGSEALAMEGLIARLLAGGADPNAPGGQSGTALQRVAVNDGSKRVFELLLKNGADPNLQSGFWGSALQVCRSRYYGWGASEHRQLDVVRILLDSGANPNAQGGEFRPALHSACYDGSLRLATLLLEKGANPNVKDDRCGSALHAACLGERSEGILRKLLEWGADPNIRGEVGGMHRFECSDVHGRTPLYTAVKKGNLECVHILLEGGADPNIDARIDYGEDSEMVQLLLRYTAVGDLVVDERD
ncbi:hypothetical protein NMY22_g18286 [Coprinellus aureogranulatus]|nr:hypothetical protein NMY22_g18286 [Coprinellus aureogranulatus]